MNNLFGGGNTLALLEEIRQLKQKISELENKQLKFVIKSVACTFSSGYTALNYSDLGVSSGFSSVFVQEVYGRNLPATSTTYTTQAAVDKLILYGRIYSNGNLALATGDRLLNLLFIY